LFCTSIFTDVKDGLALFGLCALAAAALAAAALALDGILRNNRDFGNIHDLSFVIEKVIVRSAESPNHLLELLDLCCMCRCADEAAAVEAGVDLGAKVLGLLPNVWGIAEVHAPPRRADAVAAGRHLLGKRGLG